MKRVVIIASGQTEQRALPVLVAHLREHGIGAEDVRIPPRNQDITAPVAEKIIKAAWFDRGSPPDKIVLLVDTDQGAPGAKMTTLRSSLSPRLTPEMRRAIQYAYAQQHLEAWFFEVDPNSWTVGVTRVCM